MSFLSALGLLVGLVSGGISIYEFTKNRKRPGTILAVTAIGILLAAYLVANPPFSSAKSEPGVTSIATSGNSLPGTGVTPAPTQIPSTPTPTPCPTNPCLLYQANWSSGMNGWGGSGQWKPLGGMLVTDGITAQDDTDLLPDAVIAPYQLGVITDYVVEARIQMTNCSRATYCGFGLLVREGNYNGNVKGYIGAVDDIGPDMPFSGIADIHTDTALACLTCGTSPITYVNYTPGTDWHTYRVEVKGNQIKFLIDGSTVVEVTDNRFLSGGQVGIESYYGQISVSSFKIIAL